MAKSTNINNRRYLGNKYKLLPFIKKVVDSECTDIEIVVDIFSGTGAVASAFQDKQLITNDILYSNYISNFAWFSPRKYSRKKIETIIDEYNAMVINEENYMTINFSNTYFSHDDCSKIGYIREDIETKYANKEINERERALLITSLLYAMDKIAKTCGHYDAYRKGTDFGRRWPWRQRRARLGRSSSATAGRKQSKTGCSLMSLSRQNNQVLNFPSQLGIICSTDTSHHRMDLKEKDSPLKDASTMCLRC